MLEVTGRWDGRDSERSDAGGDGWANGCSVRIVTGTDSIAATTA